jgi:hypothetical protein
MSAFIVSDYHINTLVSYGVMKSAQFWNAKERRWEYFNEDTAQVMAALLYRANVCSVNRRYGERTRTTGFQYKRVNVLSIQPADIVKACDCLDYQSCETKTWENSRARKALQAIRESAIQALTAGSQAWELREPLKEAA